MSHYEAKKPAQLAIHRIQLESGLDDGALRLTVEMATAVEGIPGYVLLSGQPSERGHVRAHMLQKQQVAAGLADEG